MYGRKHASTSIVCEPLAALKAWTDSNGLSSQTGKVSSHNNHFMEAIKHPYDPTTLSIA